jgi:hypothetical protein
MIETITMSEDKLRLLLVAFTLMGVVFGYILGRVVAYGRQLDPPKRRRTPQERHTRSHW